MFNSTPPRNLADKAKEAETLSSVADMLADLMLEADVPEEQKIGIRIIKAGKNVGQDIKAVIKRYADPTLPESPELFETCKQVLEYLGLVALGLKQFIETTPLPNENK